MRVNTLLELTALVTIPPALVLKLRVFAVKYHTYRTDRTVTLFADDDLGLAIMSLNTA